MSAAQACSVLGRRTCALLAVSSAGLHVAMVGATANPVAAAVLAAMIVGCLYCAGHLWRRGTSGVWCTIALMSLAMIALHTPMPMHHHGVVAPVQTSTMMTAATLLALLEVIIAAAVLAYTTRHRSVISPSAG
ncbi:hypothetical protein B7435_19160 [Mycolicibacterium peregrinum]|uniref:Uncharacterized protein n=1 Tax=Mycolicibacterium peregrinum TaxID=43304 RepID=A0A1X2BFL9_MYCPR|nr:hypothetical protein [Mycolicibacterium peregrinum]MCV7201501.1 hypothetical protein [Mycolicibacterium peregrinum]ORW62398.1 hypothetical protein AWC21_06100 [Mycolicibacterium peregrinum]OWM00772.1 hypothetical protein B7435_19160 [Mycolicibacterium peregrinum]TGB40128.1 hypothetical protein EJD98_19685 [Mycolicibacterium peregrinum]TGB46093.1 hypothetical protein EJD94_03700 [Mycolicibacterium peregrinum]